MCVQESQPDLLRQALEACTPQYSTTVTPRPLTAGSAAAPPFEVRVVHSAIAGAPEPLRRLHARLHPLLLFHVDAASPLQQDDPNMQLLLAVRDGPGGAPAAVLGFLTFFKCGPPFRTSAEPWPT